MKCLDLDDFRIVKTGRPCLIEEPVQLDVLISKMQKNDEFVYWLQPLGACYTKQIPAVNVNGQFLQPSVKLEKAIFRHIRLTRNFQNYELMEDGNKKLRIPIRLWKEKQRTSTKFSVRSHPACAYAKVALVCINVKLPQMMYKNIVLSSACKKKVVLRHAAVDMGLRLMLDKTEAISLTPTIENRAVELQEMLETEYPCHRCSVVFTRKLTAASDLPVSLG